MDMFSELDDSIITKFVISFHSTISEFTLFKSKLFSNSVIIIAIDFKGQLQTKEVGYRNEMIWYSE